MNTVTEQIGTTQQELFAGALNFLLAQQGGLDTKALARKTGLSQRSVNYARGGGQRSGVSMRSAEKIAAAFGLTYRHFLELGERILSGEEGGAVLADIRSRLVPARQTLHLSYRGDAPAPVSDAAPARYVTVLRRVSAGEPREFCDDDVVGRVAVGSDIPAGAWAWQVSGDSMLRPDGRGIRDGDVVFFVEESRPAHNDVVLVNDEFGDTVLKRLKLRPDGGYALVSDNPDYKSVTPNEAFRVVGKVVDVIRKPDWR